MQSPMRKVAWFQCLSCQLTLTWGQWIFFPPAESRLVNSNFPRASRMQGWACIRGARILNKLTSGAIIGDGDRLGIRADPWYGTIFLFLEQIAPSWRHISALIHARVLGSRVDVVTLRDEMVRVARFSYRFFTAKAGKKAGKKNQGPSMYLYALI